MEAGEVLRACRGKINQAIDLPSGLGEPRPQRIDRILLRRSASSRSRRRWRNTSRSRTRSNRLWMPSSTASSGPEVVHEDYRVRSNALVWFTKGIACVFCRRQMVQIGKLYLRLCELGTEILLVAPTRVEQARLYLSRFAVPTPISAIATTKRGARW
jgi:hypothetical protein